LSILFVANCEDFLIIMRDGEILGEQLG
jgi:hypothetical protein